jgi:4-hydroxymandelate oxidase
MAATVAVEDVVAASRETAGDAAPDIWFQIYIQPRMDVTEALVDRTARAGAAALVVTVDSPVLGASDRNERNGFHDLPEGMRCENMRGLAGGGNIRSIEMSAAMSWEHVDRLRVMTDLPIVVKGVLRADDARPARSLRSCAESSTTRSRCAARKAPRRWPLGLW